MENMVMNESPNQAANLTSSKNRSTAKRMRIGTINIDEGDDLEKKEDDCDIISVKYRNQDEKPRANSIIEALLIYSQLFSGHPLRAIVSKMMGVNRHFTNGSFPQYFRDIWRNFN
jgi:hypothetical protein